MDQITLTDIGLVLVLVLNIFSLLKYAKEYQQPKTDLKKQVDRNTESLVKLESRLDNIHECQKLQLKGIKMLTTHALDGNGTKEMQDYAQDLEDHIFKSL